MSRRWPNTAHWQRLESVFREIAGSRWRTEASIVVGRPRRELREIIDREFNAVELKVFNDMLVSALSNHADNLEIAADRSYSMAGKIAGEVAVTEYRFEVPVVFDDDPPVPFDLSKLHPWEEQLRDMLTE
jgi:hypothetical protein